MTLPLARASTKGIHMPTAAEVQACMEFNTAEAAHYTAQQFGKITQMAKMDQDPAITPVQELLEHRANVLEQIEKSGDAFSGEYKKATESEIEQKGYMAELAKLDETQVEEQKITFLHDISPDGCLAIGFTGEGETPIADDSKNKKFLDKALGQWLANNDMMLKDGDASGTIYERQEGKIKEQNGTPVKANIEKVRALVEGGDADKNGFVQFVKNLTNKIEIKAEHREYFSELEKAERVAEQDAGAGAGAGAGA